MDAVWPDVVVSDDSLVQCVGELRLALGSQGGALIRTLSRRGYLLDAQPCDDGASTAAPPSASVLPDAAAAAAVDIKPTYVVDMLADLLPAGVSDF